MKALTRKMLVGSLAVALAVCFCGVVLAADMKATVDWKATQKIIGSNAFNSAIVNQLKQNKGGQGGPGQGGPGQGGSGQGGQGQGGPGQGGFGQGGPGNGGLGQGGFGKGGFGKGGFGKGGPGYPPGHKHWPHHGHHVYSPVIVETSPTYYPSDDSNPVPAAEIVLVNPAENQVALLYRLDEGQVRSLAAGYTAKISYAAVISFDRGGGAARARYQLTDGVYKFVVSGGQWELVRQASQSAQYQDANTYPPTGDSNPVPGN